MYLPIQKIKQAKSEIISFTVFLNEKNSSYSGPANKNIFGV